MQNFRLRIGQDHINMGDPLVLSGGEIHCDLSNLPAGSSDWTLKVRLQSGDDIMHMFVGT